MNGVQTIHVAQIVDIDPRAYIIAVLATLIKFPNKVQYTSKSGKPVSEDHLRGQQRFWKTGRVMNNQLPAYSHT